MFNDWVNAVLADSWLLASLQKHLLNIISILHIACNVLFAGNKQEEAILPNTGLNHLMFFNRPFEGSQRKYYLFLDALSIFSSSTPPAFYHSPKWAMLKHIFKYLKLFYVVYFHCPWQDIFVTFGRYIPMCTCFCFVFTVVCQSIYVTF